MTRGVRQIVRFNWPFYAVAATVVVLSPPVIARLPVSAAVRTVLYASTGVAALWVVASLAASWIVYDRSPLMRWSWIRQALGFQPDAWINIHAGLDESTPALRALFTGTRGRVFDIFDPAEMTEPSIARARLRSLRELRRGRPGEVARDVRRGSPDLARNAVAPEPADFRRLPVPTGTIDAAMLLLSAHELRSDTARGDLFAELRRVLGPGGRVVVAEHLRDWANFAAFGPGVLHFHSRRTWTRCFARHRFDVHAEFSITPFVRIFVLRRLT
jgi:SAM-dependent methyltransferase